MKKIVNLILIIYFLLIFSCKNNNKSDSEKIKFIINANKQAHFIFFEFCNYSKLIDIEFIDKKGYVESSIFNKKSPYDKFIPHIDFPDGNCGYEYVELKDSVFVDPFVDGDCKVVFKTRKTKATERRGMTKYKQTIRGAPLQYLTDNKSCFLLLFAGPDGDYDTDLQKLSMSNFNALERNVTEYKWLNYPEQSIDIPLNNSIDCIPYDPTNGLISNGDIIWRKYKFKAYIETNGWVEGEETNPALKYLVVNDKLVPPEDGVDAEITHHKIPEDLVKSYE